MIQIKTVFLALLILPYYCQWILAYKSLTEEGLQVLTNITESESLETLDKYLKQILIPRVSDTDGNRKVQEFIKSKFKELGWTIEEDTFKDQTPYGEKTFNNIIVTKNANLTNRFVMAAHFDSKYFDPPNNFVGATDSAVPCAMLIDLAYRLDQYLTQPIRSTDPGRTNIYRTFNPMQPKLTLTLPFTSIDQHCSRHLAKKWEKTYLLTVDVPEIKSKTVLGSIETLVLLDLLGVKQPSFANYFKTTSWLFSKLADIENRLYEKRIIKPGSEDSFDDEPYFDTSTLHSSQAHIEDDHLPFLQRGVPVLHIIAYPFPAVWHTTLDNFDAIDPDTFFNLNTIFRIFAAEYLEIDPSLS
ncbi:2820_t:CDS:2 [Acaulospora colombiana]|uniref:2820_t:CDS:1 n=1 Tax=Acaulospora colombiana TaxID=27376 RepID=A0ACA9K7L6_9GLOM|nr:2820_t:CDS:2 [Acaulospora colombiana]